MSDGMTIIIGDDGKARAYDDTYDITIHCESKEEQDEVKRRLMSEPHWIPCSERLPEEQRYCLTSCKNGAVCEDFHWGNGYFDKADKYHHKVIAWMPLPKAYLGGEAE